eukprot:GEMP01085252.1.p1 GENE.GEMP01085252.1~~GEMP01085252.1.p1  ORF type:complete len:129 (+),score=34.92 GEMP01085252.1:90-476(+)
MTTIESKSGSTENKSIAPPILFCQFPKKQFQPVEQKRKKARSPSKLTTVKAGVEDDEEKKLADTWNASMIIEERILQADDRLRLRSRTNHKAIYGTRRIDIAKASGRSALKILFRTPASGAKATRNDK